jgi:hypothetical protein
VREYKQLFNNTLPTTAAPTPIATPSPRCCPGLPAHAEGSTKISVKTDAIIMMIKFLFFIFYISFSKLLEVIPKLGFSVEIKARPNQPAGILQYVEGLRRRLNADTCPPPEDRTKRLF